MASPLEREFQPKIIKDLEAIFPGCLIMKQDSGYRQGIPDLIVLFGNRWAFLEVKNSAMAPSRPNQQYYVDWALEHGSFGSFIFPENKNDVLRALQQYFR